MLAKRNCLLTEAIGIMKRKTRLDKSHVGETTTTTTTTATTTTTTTTAPRQSLEGRWCNVDTKVNDVMTDKSNDRRNILAEMDDLLPDIPTRTTPDVTLTVQDSIPMFVTVVTNKEDTFEESILLPLCYRKQLSKEEEEEEEEEEKEDGFEGKFNNGSVITTNMINAKMSSDEEIQIPSSSKPNLMMIDTDSVSSADNPFTGIVNVTAELDELSSNPKYSRCRKGRDDDDSALTLLKSNVITRNTIIEDDDTLSQTSDVVIFGRTTKAYTQFIYEIMDDVRADVRAFIGGGEDTVRISSIDDTGPIKIGNKFYSKSEAMRRWRKAKKKLAYTELVNECNDKMDNPTIKEQQTPSFIIEKVGRTSSNETNRIDNREIVSTDKKNKLELIDELTESRNENTAVSEKAGVTRSRHFILKEDVYKVKKQFVISDTENRIKSRSFSLPSAQDILNDKTVMHELKQQQEQLENELFHQYHHRLNRKTPSQTVLDFSAFITNGEEIASIDDTKGNKSSSISCVHISNEVVDDDEVSSTSKSTVGTIFRRNFVSIQNIRPWSWGESQVTPVSSYTVAEVQQHVMKANAALKLAVTASPPMSGMKTSQAKIMKKLKLGAVME